MAGSKSSSRKTAGKVRMPATKFAQLQKRLRKTTDLRTRKQVRNK